MISTDVIICILYIVAMLIQLEIKLKTFSYNKQTNFYKIYTSLLIFLLVDKYYKNIWLYFTTIIFEGNLPTFMVFNFNKNVRTIPCRIGVVLVWAERPYWIWPHLRRTHLHWRALSHFSEIIKNLFRPRK